MSEVPEESDKREVRPVLPETAPPTTGPRALPGRVRASKRHHEWIWFGSLVAAISLPALVLTVANLPDDASGWIEITPVIGMSGYGIALLSRGLWGRSKRRRVYRTGRSAVATIDVQTTVDNIQEDWTTRRSYLITWEFVVDGEVVRGRRESKDERITNFRTGDPIWVLYDPDDPASNVEWPPL